MVIKSNVEIIVAFFLILINWNSLLVIKCILFVNSRFCLYVYFIIEKMEYIMIVLIIEKMEYIIVGGNLCIQHPLLQITQVIPPPLILNITNLLFLNKTNFAIIVVMVHKEDLWLLFNFNLLQL